MKIIYAFLLILLLTFNIEAEERPKLVDLKILINKFESTQDTTYLIPVLQRCSALASVISIVFESTDTELSKRFLLKSAKVAEISVNIKKELNSKNGAGLSGDKIIKQNFAMIKLFSEKYAQWFNTNYLELGTYFEDDQLLKREIILCNEIIPK